MTPFSDSKFPFCKQMFSNEFSNNTAASNIEIGSHFMINNVSPA